ncbi:phosphonate ABC transporter, permease protein PhnE [Aerococcus mictus]|nr:phosphonate ABC transporter, permease protein PhnE [Aerococcus mictus]KAA9292216.1 phosphonate ABC transporter, permease protein PhnE [Aerococcus mictus]PKY83090.1 phosphonate ABC transporter, permease protein PhnE [Aerococcus mictus]PMB93405.1 phosphonate ABC transporter, permease protein PhnE [Aerococcus mictus]RAV63670.1 phosphonate ABC transporter, permease protein PhnE [Aerococcus mictus]
MKVFKRKEYQLASGKVFKEKRSWTPVIVLVLAIALYVALEVTEFDFADIIKRGHQLTTIVAQLFQPDWSYLSDVIQPLLDTIKMSLFGSFAGAAVALPFAFLASSNMVHFAPVNWLVKVLFTIIRTIPTLVSALIATYLFGLGTLAGTVAIFLFSFSYVGKLLYEEIETTNLGAFEAMIAMGYTRPFAFLKGVIPNIMPFYLSTALFNFEGNVRYASILGYVGAGGLGLLINENIGWRDYEKVGTILFVLLITVFIIENLSRYIRRKIS